MILITPYTVISQLLEQGRSFAVYRIPGENRIRYLEQDSCSVYTQIESLNNQCGFVIAPFCVSAENPIVLLKGEERFLEIGEESCNYSFWAKNKKESISPDYANRFRNFINSLQDRQLDKLVLSRSVDCKRSESFSAVSAFLRACQRYIRSYVYLYYTPQTGVWMGSTPEILLSGEGGNWHTVALAGTQSLLEGELPEKWDAKNLHEQQIVAEYVRTQLGSLCIQIQEEGPYTIRAGELAHLKTDFRFSLPDNYSLGDLLTLLHPTPAVCGLPKKEAYQFIQENEGYNRCYYSGFVGMLNPEGRTDLYVNLRCMQIKQEQLILYAGGGLLASSVLEEEWQETEEKLQTMNRIL